MNDPGGPQQPALQGVADLCQRIMASLGVDGVAIVLTARSVPQRVLVHCGDLGVDLPESEFALGEGPTFDASRQGSVIEVADLSSPFHSLWPAFTEAATGAGVQAIHAFPLRRGQVTLGVIELFNSHTTAFEGQQFRLGLKFADEIADALLGLPRSSDTTPAWMTPEENRLRIHQATGMVAQQLNCTVEEALDRMRAFAFAQQLSLLEISDQVLQRELVLEP